MALNVLRNVEFMYPAATAAQLDALPVLTVWRAAMEARPGIAAYLASDRNLPLLYEEVKGVPP